MSFVVDNSVALTWCFEDERTPATTDLLHRVSEAGAWAPGLWPLEAVNVLLAAERRGRLDETRRERLTRFLRMLPIAIDAETTDQSWTATAQLAKRFNLSAYTASYLELAYRLDLPLASLDQKLRQAAAQLGIELLG